MSNTDNNQSSGVVCVYVDRDVNGDQVVVYSNIASCVPSIGDGVDVGGVSYRVRQRLWSLSVSGAVMCTIELYRST